MRAILRSIHLENFKGFKDKEINFSLNTTVGGRNASGKSTIGTGYTWLLTDKDIELNSNPNVKPIDVEECTPTVTAVFDVDGKEVTVCKMQKIKTSKPDENGIVKSSSTNQYTINSVPKTERDFKAYLEELGFPTTDNLLLMSHTSIFTGMTNAKMREALFKLVQQTSDKEIATNLGTVPELVALLENYKLEEITAINKDTIKKANEQLNSIPAQIEGLELAKVEEVDTSEQELLISSLNEKIAETQANIENLTNDKNKLENIDSKLMSLGFDRSSELQAMEKTASSGKEEIEHFLSKACDELVDIRRREKMLTQDIERAEQTISRNNEKRNELKGDYDKAKALSWDSSKNICPYCKQELPAKMQEEMIDHFEDEKQSKMQAAIKEAQTLKDEVIKLQEEVVKMKESLKAAKSASETAEKLKADYEKQLADFKPTEVKPTDKLKAIDSEIEKLKAERETLDKNYYELLNSERQNLSALQAQLNETNKQIGAATNNVRIDEQIQELQDRQIKLEQSKADAEKVIYQVDLLSKSKNELVAKEINSYFDLVEFKLWEMQKNGTLKDACIPTYKGKELGVSTNTALEMLIKIDICKGFQKFNGVELPIFVDGAELFDSKTIESIKADNQLVFLKVTDGDLEVKGE